MPQSKLSWHDIDELAYALAQTHSQLNPLSIRFTQLRQLVETLPNFQPLPGQQVNEQILEAIQAAWIEEADADDSPPSAHDDDSPSYKPNNPFRPPT